ncbi:CYTH domain-containing protein [Candidatus Woesearchaeota archaeon]|nr:CYTH domain-containing protein [Candidatus Woesearchaeota archaeon]
MENNIEVEVKSLISKGQYEKLLEFFNNNAKLIKEDYQETYYFDTKDDFRIQKNNFFSKLVYKKGKIHDETREEIEIKFSKDEFAKLEKVFLLMGINVQIKWFRDRKQFDWHGVDVCVDHTRGYGYILELEILSNETEKDNKLQILKDKFSELGIEITSREEFDNKFNYYKENWKSLI